MGYQVSPTLPDYSKLVFMLNNAGVQKWNPAVYDVLKNLIEAVQQSQDVVVNSVIPGAAGNALSTVSVNPAGALSGNGTISSPLAAIVDGTTIQINGSDQLTAILPYTPLVKRTEFTHTTLNAWGGVEQTLVPGIGGSVLVPLYVSWKGIISTQSSTSSSGNFYHTGSVQNWTSGTLITAGLAGNRFGSFASGGYNIQSAVDLRGLGLTVVPTASTTGLVLTGNFVITIAYMVVP